MATLEYVFACVLMIGLCVCFAVALLACAAVLIKIAIDFIKGD